MPPNDAATPPDEGRFEDLLERDRADGRSARVRKQIHLWGPIVGTAALAVLLGMLIGWDNLRAVVIKAVVSAVFAGKFIILAGVSSDLGPWVLAAVVVYLDVIVALILAYNLDVIYRLPWIGGKLLGLQEYGRYTLRQKPYLRRLSFIGLAVFVLFPIAATGAVGGSILGRLLGMRPYRIVLAIATGSVVGCSAMAAFAEVLASILEPIKDKWWFHAIGVAAVGAFVLVLIRRYRALEATLRARSGSGGARGDSPR